MDVYFFDVDWLPLTTVLAAFSIFPVQLLLCFKVKSRVLRFLPLILLHQPQIDYLHKLYAEIMVQT